MKISVIVPAFNEEKLLPRCLDSIRSAFSDRHGAEISHEVIVVDNNSSDGTATIARERGLVVVFEPINQISRARNAGATAATGDWLLFVDADSLLDSACLRDLIDCICQGRTVGGGCVIGFVDSPLIGRMLTRLWNIVSRLMKWAAGSFVFCRADAFREVGGFPAEVFAAEEVLFSQALKSWARTQGMTVTILSCHPHRSSPRKLRLYSFQEYLVFLSRLLFSPRKTLKDPKRLGLFYDGRR